jgi:hypothetical protein
MLMRTAVGAACALAACLGLGIVGGDSADGAVERFKRCGRVDVGYTDARVKARNLRCRTARRVVRRFVRKYPGAESQRCVLRSCRVMRRFGCTLGGVQGTVVLRCSNFRRPFRDKDLRARWGD